MTQSPSEPAMPSPFDWLTLIAISALAYIIAVALHEHLGHTAACLILGSHPKEVGAFYVDCNYTGMSEFYIRLVALAGPVVSLGIGIVCFHVLHRHPPRTPTAYYFVWLLGSIGLMSATGYLLFSGISGIGDLGTTPDGVFYMASPEWLYRIVLSIAGIASYVWVIHIAVREIDPHFSGSGTTRIHYARMLVLVSYITGAVVYTAIGMLNPHGFVIVATSAVASSMGATSGLLWMMQLLDRQRQVPSPGLMIKRSWAWIAAGCIVTVFYAVILGPTIYY